MAEPIIIIKEPGPPPIGGSKEDDGPKAEGMEKPAGQGSPPSGTNKKRTVQIEFEGSNKPPGRPFAEYESDRSLVGAVWHGEYKDGEVRITRVN